MKGGFMETKPIKLKYSIPILKEGGGTSTTNEIIIGRLKAKHLRLLPDNFTENEGSLSPAEIIPLIAGLANISIESADEIDIEDLTEIAEGLESFLLESLKTGEK